MKQYDVVELLYDKQQEGLTKGQCGAILEFYDKSFCEVEISDSDGITIFLGVLPFKALRVVNKDEQSFI